MSPTLNVLAAATPATSALLPTLGYASATAVKAFRERWAAKNDEVIERPPRHMLPECDYAPSAAS